MQHPAVFLVDLPLALSVETVFGASASGVAGVVLRAARHRGPFRPAGHPGVGPLSAQWGPQEGLRLFSAALGRSLPVPPCRGIFVIEMPNLFQVDFGLWQLQVHIVRGVGDDL